VWKIGEPRAGFDLRKRTLGDGISEGLPITVWRAMVDDEPMDVAGGSTFRLDQNHVNNNRLGERPEDRHDRQACRWESIRITSHCVTAFSLGLFVSFVCGFIRHLFSIRGVCYQRAS